MSDTVTIPLSKEFKLEVEKALVRYKALQREYEEDYKKVAQFHKELANKLEPDVAKIFEQWDGVDYKLTPEYKTVHGFFGSKKVRDCLKVEPLDLFDTNSQILVDFVDEYCKSKGMLGSITNLQVQNMAYESFRKPYGRIHTTLLHTGFFHVRIETDILSESKQPKVKYLSDLLGMFDSVEGKEISMSVSNYNKYFKEV